MTLSYNLCWPRNCQPMSCDKPYNGQFLLTPLPTSFHKHISLAHGVVNMHNRKTQCRILNPTHSPVSLNKRTILATVTPISNSQIFAYDKSHETPPVPTVDFASQLKTLNDLGIDVSATAYTQPQKEQLVAFYTIISISSHPISPSYLAQMLSHIPYTQVMPCLFINVHTDIHPPLGKK